MKSLLIKQASRIIWVLLGVVLILGCSTTTTPKLGKPEIENGSLVFGYIDMEDAPSWYQWIEMKSETQPKKEPRYFWVKDGMFFRVDVSPDRYRLTEFGGSNRYTNSEFRFTLPEQPQFRREINKPGVYFIGSYRYKSNTPLVGRYTFDLLPSKTPSERELLEKILVYAEHEHWRRIIVQRLNQLKK